MRFGSFGQNGVDHEQAPTAAPGQRLANVAQNFQRMLVVPIVNDVLQEVSVSPGRDLFKEVAGHGLATVIHAHLAQRALGALYHVGQVQEHSLHVGIPS